MNPYEELGVDPKADTPTIKRAYRKRAKKLHPDGGGTQEAFDRLSQAHLVLSDPVRWSLLTNRISRMPRQ